MLEIYQTHLSDTSFLDESSLLKWNALYLKIYIVLDFIYLEMMNDKDKSFILASNERTQLMFYITFSDFMKIILVSIDAGISSV